MVWTREGGGHYDNVTEICIRLSRRTSVLRDVIINGIKTLLGAENKVHMQETDKLPETINLTKHPEYLKPVHPYYKDQRTNFKQKCMHDLQKRIPCQGKLE